MLLTSGSSREHLQLLHERSSPLEQVGASVGRLDTVRIHVSQRQPAHLARRVRALRSPVTEARTEPARRRTDSSVWLLRRAGERP